MVPDPTPADELPCEVVMLCSLLARIIYRCLKERDARVLALLGKSAEEPSEVQAPPESPVSH
jgi:hypothetical protein